MLTEYQEQLKAWEEEQMKEMEELCFPSALQEQNKDSPNNLEISDLSQVSQEAKELGSSMRSTSTGKHKLTKAL